MIIEIFLALIMVYLIEKAAQFWDDWENGRRKFRKSVKFKYIDLKDRKKGRF